MNRVLGISQPPMASHEGVFLLIFTLLVPCRLLPTCYLLQLHLLLRRDI